MAFFLADGKLFYRHQERLTLHPNTPQRVYQPSEKGKSQIQKLGQLAAVTS